MPEKNLRSKGEQVERQVIKGRTSEHFEKAAILILKWELSQCRLLLCEIKLSLFFGFGVIMLRERKLRRNRRRLRLNKLSSLKSYLNHYRLKHMRKFDFIEASSTSAREELSIRNLIITTISSHIIINGTAIAPILLQLYVIKRRQYKTSHCNTSLSQLLTPHQHISLH